jgi:predicted DNA-binding protein
MMKTIIIKLPADQVEALRAWKAETGAPVAELIRRAIALYLKQLKKY